MLSSKDKQHLELIVTIIQLAVNNCDFSVYATTAFRVSFSDIVNVINELTGNGYLETAGNGYALTESGSEYYAAINKILRRKGIYRYISVDPSNIIEKIPIDKPYLPNK